jgi:hypothetical protein
MGWIPEPTGYGIVSSQPYVAAELSFGHIENLVVVAVTGLIQAKVADDVKKQRNCMQPFPSSVGKLIDDNLYLYLIIKRQNFRVRCK